MPLLDELKNFLAEIVREEINLALAKNANPAPLLINIATAAAILEVLESWVASAARRGDLPSVRLGHHVRFKVSDLQKFIESKCQAA